MPETNPLNVVVIGAGLGGLSAAAHLVKAGHDVTIVERQSIPGGRAGTVISEGFRLDNGPTVLTMPNLLEEAFNAAGAEMSDFVTIQPVDPMYRAVFADGSTLFVRHGRQAMTDEIRQFSGAGDAEAFGRFCDWLEKLYRAEMDSFIDANFDTPLDLIKPWRSGLELVRLGGFGRLGKKVASFFDDERLRRIFSFQSMYAGLAPYQALALYAVITYMDSVEGVYAPEGGMHQMAAGLASAVEKAGVDIRYSSPVTKIVRESSGRVTGVEIDGSERLAADAVVCNVDLPVAYRELLDGVSAPRAARKGNYSPSCLLWVAGVNGLPPTEASHHNIHFGAGWEDSFKALIDDGVRMPTRRSSSRCKVSTTRRSRRRARRASMSSSRHRTCLARSTGRASATGSWPICGSGSTGWVTRPTSSSRRSTTRPTGSGWAWSRAHRLPWRTPSSRPDRSARTTSTRRCPVWCSPDRRRCRASACRWCSSRASSPPSGSVSTRAVVDHAAARQGPSPRHRPAAPAPTTQRLPAGPVTLDESYALCREFNKLHGTTYYWSTKVLPRVKQHHVHALYAFARYADDIVDEIPSQNGRDVPTDVRAAALADFGDHFLDDLEAGRSDDPVLKAVVHTVRAFDIDVDAFHRFLGSMTMDLTVDSYDTWDDLLVYMDGSAAVIGEMMLPILEPSDYDVALPHARDLGNAFQLTNVLRDIDEDLDRGRQYVPMEDSRRFGAELAARKVTPEFVELMRFEIERCRALYKSADVGISMLPDRSARSVRAAHTLYGRILDKIEQQQYDVFTSRATVSTVEKARVVASLLRR